MLVNVPMTYKSSTVVTLGWVSLYVVCEFTNLCCADSAFYFPPMLYNSSESCALIR